MSFQEQSSWLTPSRFQQFVTSFQQGTTSPHLALSNVKKGDVDDDDDDKPDLRQSSSSLSGTGVVVSPDTRVSALIESFRPCLNGMMMERDDIDLDALLYACERFEATTCTPWDDTGNRS